MFHVKHWERGDFAGSRGWSDWVIIVRKESERKMEITGEIRVEWIPINSLGDAKENPKDHDIGAIVESIRKFGFVGAGALIDENTGRKVTGHGREEALQVMFLSGEDIPRGIRIDDKGDWLMPVLRGYAFQDEEEARAFLLADNRTQELGGWKENELAVVLKEMVEKGEEMLAGTGFDAEDAQEIMERVMGKGVENGDNATEEEEEEGKEEENENSYGVEVGDVWQVGEHVVMCGDCRDENTWRILLGSVKEKVVNGVVTSPPYANQRDWAYGGVDISGYVDWWENVQANVMRHLSPDGSFFINIKPHTEENQRVLYVFDLVLAMVRKWEWMFIDEFCWERVGIPGSWPNRFKNGFEPVYQFAQQGRIKFRPDNVLNDHPYEYAWGGISVSTGKYFNTSQTGFSVDKTLPSNRIGVRENVIGIHHEAAFPWKLPLFFVKGYSDDRDVWCDPFCGSGSTLVACAKCNRKGLGIEMLPRHVSETIFRLEQATGEKARRIS
jgi:site-specific DNA-methyltransferase (adenine-specific)/site-specific DNA-methyltransferase (cytosine-N4-specific)